MNKQLVIIGIDPGTTVGCAVINISGNLITSFSSKEFDLGSLITKLVGLGFPLIIATDKKDVPSFAGKLATKLGARVSSPKEDLLQTEKRMILAGKSLRNGHEEDAYASAIFAYNEIRPILAKIDRFVLENKKQKIRNEIIQLVILNRISIRRSVELLEKPNEKETKIIREVIEKRQLCENDYLFLYDKLKKTEYENRLLREKLKHLEDEIKEALAEKESLKTRLTRVIPDKKANELVKQKEKRIRNVFLQLETERNEIESQTKKINELFKFIANTSSRVLLKKLDNLGWNEYVKKKNLLNISEGDVLLVDDPIIYSQKALDELKNKVTYIFYKDKVSKEIEKNTKFVFIKQEKFHFENEYFALVHKKEFDKLVDGKVLIEKILGEYKEKRISGYP